MHGNVANWCHEGALIFSTLLSRPVAFNKSFLAHDKAELDMATILLQEEAARALIEKEQEQPQFVQVWETAYKNAKGEGREPLAQLIGLASNAKGEGREPLAQLIGLASNALLVQPDLLVRRTTKKEEKEGSDGQEGTNYSQGDAHVRLIKAIKCAEELRMNDQ